MRLAVRAPNFFSSAPQHIRDEYPEDSADALFLDFALTMKQDSWAPKEINFAPHRVPAICPHKTSDSRDSGRPYVFQLFLEWLRPNAAVGF